MQKKQNSHFLPRDSIHIILICKVFVFWMLNLKLKCILRVVRSHITNTEKEREKKVLMHMFGRRFLFT